MVISKVVSIKLHLYYLTLVVLMLPDINSTAVCKYLQLVYKSLSKKLDKIGCLSEPLKPLLVTSLS